MKRIDVLGSRAGWGAVGYTGEAFAPHRRTYAGVDAIRLNYTTAADAGAVQDARGLANLYPLIAAALYEAGFALEAGPLTTWAS